MKKLDRLIEIKRQAGLAHKREGRIVAKIKKLNDERKDILNSFSQDEMRLYGDRIEKAYQW